MYSSTPCLWLFLIPSPTFVCEENSYPCSSYCFSMTRGRNASSNPGSWSWYLVISEWIRHAPCQVRDGAAAATALNPCDLQNAAADSKTRQTQLVRACTAPHEQMEAWSTWAPVKMAVFQKPCPDYNRPWAGLICPRLGSSTSLESLGIWWQQYRPSALVSLKGKSSKHTSKHLRGTI